MSSSVQEVRFVNVLCDANGVIELHDWHEQKQASASMHTCVAPTCSSTVHRAAHDVRAASGRCCRVDD
jgi:ribosomal protein S27AE